MQLNVTNKSEILLQNTRLLGDGGWGVEQLLNYLQLLSGKLVYT